MTDYFMVGTIHGGWHGDDAREMLDDWIEAGEWVLGWNDMESDPSYRRQAPNLGLIEEGDVLIAKQMNNDFRTMLVKAVGVVTEPSTDGHASAWIGCATVDQHPSRSSRPTARP
jgi:hypothetical protein